MGRINISFGVVRQKTEEMKKRTETGLKGEILPRYDELSASMEQSCGRGMDTIRDALKQERDTLEKVNMFMMELLEFIQDSADAFEHVDVNHEEVIKKFV